MHDEQGAEDVPSPPQTETEADTTSGTARPLHDARDLTGGGTQAWIRLDDKLYSLMITRSGKLILTK